MSHYGRNPFPRRFGGGKREHELEHEALLDAYAPGWDVSEGTEIWCEAYGEALAISFIWAINNRVSNQSRPMKMLERLQDWETILRLRPTLSDTDVARRKRIAARLRGVANNTLTDIYDACLALLGNNFAGIATVSSANEINYWPGQLPGPPGLEWSSNRCRMGIKMTKNGLSNDDFLSLRQQCADLVVAMLPAWMTFQIGLGSSFVVNQGIVGETFL